MAVTIPAGSPDWWKYTLGAAPPPEWGASGAPAPMETSPSVYGNYGTSTDGPTSMGPDGPSPVMSTTTNPGGLQSLFEDPDVVANFSTAPSVQLPQSGQAMDALRHAQLSGLSGLEGLLQGAPQRNQAIEDAMYEEAARDINRTAERKSLSARESTFGRGVGLSSITNDYLSDINREQFDSLASARRQAILGAGAEARANQSAQLAAVGQAFNQGTSGLQAEANVGLSDAKNQAQGSQFGVSTAGTNLTNRLNREQQSSQFGQELASRTDLEAQRRDLQRDISNNTLLAGGISAGLGGLSSLFNGVAR